MESSWAPLGLEIFSFITKKAVAGIRAVTCQKELGQYLSFFQDEGHQYSYHCDAIE